MRGRPRVASGLKERLMSTRATDPRPTCSCTVPLHREDDVDIVDAAASVRPSASIGGVDYKITRAVLGCAAPIHASMQSGRAKVMQCVRLSKARSI